MKWYKQDGNKYNLRLWIYDYYSLLSSIHCFQHAGARDDKGNPIIKDFYSSPLTARYASLIHQTCSKVDYQEYSDGYISCSGNTHDDTVLAKFESVYTGSGDPGSSMVSCQ